MKKPKDKYKPIAYFKTEYGRHGDRKIVRYLKVLDNGCIKVIDVTRLKTSSIRTFGSIPMEVFVSTENEWNKAYDKVMNNFER